MSYDEWLYPPSGGGASYDPIPDNPGGSYATPVDYVPENPGGSYETPMDYSSIPENPGGSYDAGYSNAGEMGPPSYLADPNASKGWLEQAYAAFLGPGTALGGKGGAFGGTPGAGGQGLLPALLNVGSGIYGMNQVGKQRRMAQQAISGSSPWHTQGGGANAGQALTRVINGDFAGDGGFELAQQAAARSSASQPGGFAASAAATAALRYQNERIQALSGPAGVGFSPASGYQLGMEGNRSANDLASRSFATLGYATGGNASSANSMPPWLTQYLIQNKMA